MKEITILVRGTVDTDKVREKGRDGKPLRRSARAKLADEATGKAMAVAGATGRELVRGLREAGVILSHASAQIEERVAAGVHSLAAAPQREDLLEEDLEAEEEAPRHQQQQQQQQPPPLPAGDAPPAQS